MTPPRGSRFDAVRDRLAGGAAKRLSEGFPAGGRPGDPGLRPRPAAGAAGGPRAGRGALPVLRRADPAGALTAADEPWLTETATGGDRPALTVVFEVATRLRPAEPVDADPPRLGYPAPVRLGDRVRTPDPADGTARVSGLVDRFA
ncbi:hypothetical protein [Amycolatopsis sp. cmx-8-4]|uniref:hypothetical protein n=1 Tax=Amycolatopsis sp. cmx-8-4 TaxID=2790947 RepID=UPI00397BF275